MLALSGAASATPTPYPQATATMAASGNTLELNDSTVNESIGLYPFFVLDVYKQGCNPCQRMKQAIIELSVELGSQAAFGMMDGRYSQMTESVYNVSSYPTLLVYKNGTLVDEMKGFASKRYIVDRLRLMNPGLDTSRVTFK